MDSRSFMFDLVILNVWVDDFDYQNNTLSVDVCFNETEFTVESNPEKCGEFKQGRTCEFDEYPDVLKTDLADRPLKLTVKCNDAETVGASSVAWPQELLDKLEKENFMQYSHFEQCDLLCGRDVAGKIGIQYRLRAKCECSELDGEEEDRRCDIQNEIKRIVNPNELFFLIQNDSDACSMVNALNDKQPPCPTALDLSKFKDFHGQIVRDPGQFDQVYSLDCCHTKKYPTGEPKPNPCANSTPAPPPRSCGKGLGKFGEESKSSMQWACKANQHVRECPHSNKFSDETGSCSCDFGNDPGASADPNSEIFANGKMKNICSYPESPPALTETQYIRPKLCPVCNSDVSWLPKLAACPKCGHKPTPYAVEKPYNENLTADQILEEWAVETPKGDSHKDKISKRTNRCTCKNGKVCAFCKIRKLCKDVLKIKKCRDPGAKTSLDSASSLKGELPDQICKSPNGTESRTYLARVFSELRDLYNLKPDMKKRGFEYNAPCEKAFVKPKATKRNKVKRSATSIDQKKKTDLKKMSPEVKAKWCRGKLYNYKAVRKYPGTLIGHKTCVSSGKSVPRNMGWLWSADAIGNRRGWRPGAIRKPIKEIMKYFLKDFPVDSLGVSRYARKAVVKKESEELVQKPTLHICKKNGVYIVTMRPLKDASQLKECADPYMPMKPLRFKIVKNPLLVHASQMKKTLKKQFHKCTCHRPVSQCYCRTYLDKKRLEFEINKACRQKGIPSLKDTLVLSDTSDSDVEFDFGVTPPAGVIKPQLKNRPDLACHETQYNEKDWSVKPAFPMKMNKYMRPYDAAGGRISADGGDWGLGGNGGGGGWCRGGRGGGRGGWGPGGRGGWGPGGRGGWGPGGRGGRGGWGRGGRGGRGGQGGPPGPEGVYMASGTNVGGAGTGAVGSGGVGGMGGVGGNTGAGRLGASAARMPLFCNLARRRKACNCCMPCSCMPCMPIC